MGQECIGRKKGITLSGQNQVNSDVNSTLECNIRIASLRDYSWTMAYIFQFLAVWGFGWTLCRSTECREKGTNSSKFFELHLPTSSECTFSTQEFDGWALIGFHACDSLRLGAAIDRDLSLFFYPADDIFDPTKSFLPERETCWKRA